MDEFCSKWLGSFQLDNEQQYKYSDDVNAIWSTSICVMRTGPFPDHEPTHNLGRQRPKDSHCWNLWKYPYKGWSKIPQSLLYLYLNPPYLERAYQYHVHGSMRCSGSWVLYVMVSCDQNHICKQKVAPFVGAWPFAQSRRVREISTKDLCKTALE